MTKLLSELGDGFAGDCGIERTNEIFGGFVRRPGAVEQIDKVVFRFAQPDKLAGSGI